MSKPIDVPWDAIRDEWTRLYDSIVGKYRELGMARPEANAAQDALVIAQTNYRHRTDAAMKGAGR